MTGDLQIVRSGYLTGNSACHSHSAVGKVNFGFRMTHSSDEITVRCRDAFFSFCQYTHMTTQAGSAGRSTDSSPRFYKFFNNTFFKGIKVHLLSSRYDYTAYTRVYMPVFKYLDSKSQILETTVCATPDYSLIDFYSFYLAYRFGIGR